MSAASVAEMERGFVPVTVVGAHCKKNQPVKANHTSADTASAAISSSAATPTRPTNKRPPHTTPRQTLSTPQHHTASPHFQPNRHVTATPAPAPNFAQPNIFLLLATATISPPSSTPSPSLPPSAASNCTTAVRSSIESELMMSRVDRRKAKKKRKLILAGKGSPTVHDIHSVYGPSPRASIQLKLHDYFNEPSNCCLRAREVHQLINWVIGEEVSPKWVFVKNKALVEQVVLLVIDGLSWAAWQQRKVEWERMRAFFQPEEKEQPVRMVVKTSLFSPHTVMQDYCSVAIKRDRADRSAVDSANKRQKTADEMKANEQKQAAINPLEFCLTESEMHNNKYPIQGEEDGFLSSCDHHQLQGEERRRKVEEAREAGLHCIHTHPTQDEEVKDGSSGGSDGGGVHVSPELEMEVLAERMDEGGEREEGEIKDGESGPEKKDVSMEDDFVLHTSLSGSATPAVPHSSTSFSAWSASAAFPPLYAIDCEMCYTSVGLELTRLTLIDSHCRTLVDTLVVPSNPITNYNTQYSGITADMLADCTTTLQQARHRLLSILPASAILVGHSAENDLRASRIFHLRVIDTALLFPHPRGPPHKSSLRYLVQRWLNREIQGGGGGHDSVEDAWAAMELVCEKVKRGREWGVQRGDTELLADVVTRWGRKVCWVGSVMGGKRWGGRAATVIATSTDEQTTDRAVKAVSGGEYGLVMAHYTSLHTRLEEEAATALTDQSGREMRVGAAMRHMDGLVTAVLKASRVNSLLVVLSGQGSTAGVKAMQHAKAELNEGRGDVVKAPPSTEKLDAQINAAVTELQSGVGWFAVRQ